MEITRCLMKAGKGFKIFWTEGVYLLLVDGVENPRAGESRSMSFPTLNDSLAEVRAWEL